MEGGGDRDPGDRQVRCRFAWPDRGGWVEIAETKSKRAVSPRDVRTVLIAGIDVIGKGQINAGKAE
jgi:hypothetical protein